MEQLENKYNIRRKGITIKGDGGVKTEGTCQS